MTDLVISKAQMTQAVEEVSRGKRNKKTQRQRRFIDPKDKAPAWDLGFVDEFDRATCYENTSDEA